MRKRFSRRSLAADALAIFGIHSSQSHFAHAQLMGARQQGYSWTVESAAAPVTFRAFPDIRHEDYRLYHDVSA